MSKQVLVQRMLLPHRSGQAYDVVEVKDLQNKLVNRHESPSSSNGNDKLSPDSSSMSTIVSDELELQGKGDELQSETGSSQDQTGSITPDSIDTKYSHSTTTDEPSEETNAFLNEQTTDSIPFDECTSGLFKEGCFFSSYISPSIFTASSIFKGIPPMSPMHLLRDSSSNSRWLEENLNDFSLNSLLGHLDEINGNRDITVRTRHTLFRNKLRLY